MDAIRATEAQALLSTGVPGLDDLLGGGLTPMREMLPSQEALQPD